MPPRAKNQYIGKLVRNNKPFAILSLLVVIAVVGFAGVELTKNSFAASGSQFCTTTPAVACLNAWGGGPWVYVYQGRGGSNNDFTLGYDSTTHTEFIRYTGGGPWNNKCIGDAYNKSGDNNASLDPCPSGSYTGGWGTNFYQQLCANGGYQFYNLHWKGYLYPALYDNGAQYLLGNGTPACFHT